MNLKTTFWTNKDWQEKVNNIIFWLGIPYGINTIVYANYNNYTMLTINAIYFTFCTIIILTYNKHKKQETK